MELKQKKQRPWQKERYKCAYCGAYKYRQYLKHEMIHNQRHWVCTNEDKCAQRCANYK
jgi:hypothetical protein